jgi:hypothetical protein
MVCQLARDGTATVKEVLSMRLGKEQAVGYVEDTDSLEEAAAIDNTTAGALPAEEFTTAPADGLPLTPAEASLTPR